VIAYFKNWISLPPALAGGNEMKVKNGFSHSNNSSSLSNTY